MSVDDVTNTDLRDLNYNLQLDKIMNTAVGSDKIKPRKIESPFTEEMIKEYQKELNKPFTVFDVHGVKHEYKYHPASTEPILDAYVPPHVVHNPRDIERVLNDALVIRNDIMDKFVNFQLEIADLRDKLNRGAFNVKSKKPTAIAIAAANKRTAEVQKYIADAPIEEAKFRTEIGRIEGEIRRIEQDKDENDQRLNDNRAEETRVKNKNTSTIKTFVEEMTMLNSGRFDVNKLPNETDEDYLDRLKANAEAPADTGYLEAEAELFNMNKFKENMKHLILSNITIESLMRGFDRDDLVAINSVFGAIKEAFLKTFGYNNKNLSQEEIRDFLLNYANQRKGLLMGNLSIHNPSYLMTPTVPSVSSLPLALGVAATLPPNVKQLTPEIRLINEAPDKCVFVNTDTGQELHIKLGIHKKEIFVMFSHNGVGGTYENVHFGKTNAANPAHNRNFKTLLTDLGLSLGELSKLFGTEPTKANVEKSFENLGLVSQPTTSYRYEAKAGGHGQHIVGMGLHVDKLPKFCPFGKILIKLDKLYYKNILAVKDHLENNIKGFRDCPVSDEFVELIMRMCKGYKPTPLDIKGLKVNEKELYDMLLYVSGVHKVVHSHTKDITVEKLKARLELVEGEISSGNNNLKLLQELKDILDKLANLNVISKLQSNKHFKEIEKEFF